MPHYTVNYVNSFKGEVVFNGIPFGYIDRTGHWAVWRVGTMFQAARVALFRAGNMFNLQDLSTDEMTLFLVKQAFRLKPDVHRLKPYAKNLPLNFELSLQSVRNSSLQFVQTLRHGSTNAFLGDCVISMVSVDKQSRRPGTLPEWFKGKYREYQTDDNPAHKSFPAIPNDAFSCQIIPCHSDMDANNHVNQSNYIKYCMNCATDAALSGYYKHYNDDMCLYPVLEIDLYYVGESVAGDKLNMITWQGEDFDQIYFSLIKDNKQVLRSRFLFGHANSANPSSLKTDPKL